MRNKKIFALSLSLVLLCLAAAFLYLTPYNVDINDDSATFSEIPLNEKNTRTALPTTDKRQRHVFTRTSPISKAETSVIAVETTFTPNFNTEILEEKIEPLKSVPNSSQDTANGREERITLEEDTEVNFPNGSIFNILPGATVEVENKKIIIRLGPQGGEEIQANGNILKLAPGIMIISDIPLAPENVVKSLDIGNNVEGAGCNNVNVTPLQSMLLIVTFLIFKNRSLSN